MAYCQASDVETKMGRLSKNISATSVPSTADITTFITSRANQIDAALGSLGLSVPVTAPAWFVADLVRLNAEGAAADMHLAAFVTNDSNDRGVGGMYLKSFEDTLDDYRRGIGVPTGVAVAEADFAVRSNATGPTGHASEPLFSRRSFGITRERRW